MPPHLAGPIPDALESPLKLAGSKRRVIHQIVPLVPRPAPRGFMVIPFFGTGSDTLAWLRDGRPIMAVGDACAPLIAVHRCIRSDPWRMEKSIDAWIDRTGYLACASKERQAELYLELRDELNGLIDGWTRSQDRANEVSVSWEVGWRFFVLLRLAFNGLCRFNRSGHFNAPMGAPAKGPVTSVYNASEVIGWSLVLNKFPSPLLANYHTLLAMATAEDGDVVYMDPPYWGTFSNYVPGGFDHDVFVREVQDLTCDWGMSNSTLGPWSDLFPTAQQFDIRRSGNMTCKADDRGAVTEILLVRRRQSLEV